jgi:hypothetical protein
LNVESSNKPERVLATVFNVEEMKRDVDELSNIIRDWNEKFKTFLLKFHILEEGS